MFRVNLAPFLIRCLLLMLALSALWLVVASPYTEALAAAVRLLLPGHLDTQASGSTLDFVMRSPSGTSFQASLSMETWGFGYGLVLAGALILSTPGPKPLARMGWLAAAWAVLFIAEALVTAIFARTAYPGLGSQGNPRLLTVGIWLVYGVWMVLPLVLWFVWPLCFWLPRRRSARRNGRLS